MAAASNRCLGIECTGRGRAHAQADRRLARLASGLGVPRRSSFVEDEVVGGQPQSEVACEARITAGCFVRSEGHRLWSGNPVGEREGRAELRRKASRPGGKESRPGEEINRSRNRDEIVMVIGGIEMPP